MFSCTDTTADLEHFYNSVVEVFEEPDEQYEVNDLLVCWNQ